MMWVCFKIDRSTVYNTVESVKMTLDDIAPETSDLKFDMEARCFPLEGGDHPV